MSSKYLVKDNLDLNINSDSTILLVIEGNKININYLIDNCEVNILIFNNTNDNVLLNETGDITNSNVNITYLELNNYEYKQVCNINVNKDSSLNINSIYLGINNKNIVFDIYNKGINSLVNINNNVVCLNDADFSLDVIGNIIKGAKNSKCHQKSQCLTFENPKKARVLPVLNIDENDVEASHALSSGTIDEEVLFYMNARGLTRKDALSLLLVSYLMPNEDFYKQYEDGLKIKEIADKKVETLCTM